MDNYSMSINMCIKCGYLKYSTKHYKMKTNLIQIEFSLSILHLNVITIKVLFLQSVNRLSVETRHIVKGHHTRKTAAFVRACAAYCYITVPSITSVLTRLQLYLLSGEVALLNQCLGQG
jgi:hypothetical protein